MNSSKRSLLYSNKPVVLQQRAPIPFPETLKPQYWPIWLGLSLLWLISKLPLSWQTRIGAGLGNILYHLMRKRRRISAINLQLCFPEKSAEEKEALLKNNFRHLGMLLIDSGLSWWGSRKRLERLAHFSGNEHLEKALAEGKGAILLTCHMTSLELGGQLLAMRYPLQVMYKRSRNALTEAIILRGRQRFTHRVFKHDDIRSMLRGLREGLAAWYSPDQDFGRKRSVFADFMGVPAATVRMTAVLAGRSGAPVIPYFPIRLPDNQGFEIRILPPLMNFPSGDDVKDARAVNTAIEGIVRQYPEQYLWLHRRFKTRPKGAPPVYD